MASRLWVCRPVIIIIIYPGSPLQLCTNRCSPGSHPQQPYSLRRIISLEAKIGTSVCSRVCLTWCRSAGAWSAAPAAWRPQGGRPTDPRNPPGSAQTPETPVLHWHTKLPFSEGRGCSSTRQVFSGMRNKKALHAALSLWHIILSTQKSNHQADAC